MIRTSRDPGYCLSHPKYPSFKANTCLLISDIKTLVLRYDDFRFWTHPNINSVIRHVKFPRAKKIHVVLPDAWWPRGKQNLPYEREYGKLVRERLEGDGESVEVDLRLVYKLGEVFGGDDTTSNRF